jgi:alkanesulfonate monooxygenase SsuD/methylene tetrahydromethanopterin reductase-like flavin-dependent oxidoreductase (luciferase family)
VRFGIFFELSVPRPFSRQVEQQVYRNALEQVRLADELGFDVVWAVEHHFLKEYSHCTAPELFLTACAQQTRRLRVGHGAVVCVPEINHPVRVAERAAVLDILSEGRLELGTARASTWTELGGFQVDPDTTKKSWDEYVTALPRMWTQERFAHDGTTFSMPERAVLPKPVQEPHPPLWVAVTSPGTEIDAADRGIGCLGVAAASFADQQRRTDDYRRRIQLCDPVGAVNDRVTTMNFLYCHEDARRAVDVGGGMFQTFMILNGHLLWARELYPTAAYQTLGNLAPRAGGAGREASPEERRPFPDGVAIGDPGEVIEAIEVWDSMGIDGINFVLNTTEYIPQEEVLASMRLFAAEVMPKFSSGGS